MKHRSEVLNASAFANLCLLLNQGEYTKHQMAEGVGITIGTCLKWVNMLHRMKLIYIAGWNRGLAGAPAAVWTWGFEGRDAPRPKAMTQAQYSDRYRSKKRGTFGLGVVPTSRVSG